MAQETSRRRRLAGVSLGFLAAFGLVELGLRLAFPPHRFRDPNSDCYWVLELEERVRKHDPSEFVDMELDEELGWSPKRSFDSGVGLTTNSRGLRGTPEFSDSKNPGRMRIAVFGDSFTYGLALRDEETFCARMRAALAPAEVLNFGVNGYGTDQQYLYWRARGLRTRPDVVLLAFYLPDFHRNAFSVRGAPKPRLDLAAGEFRVQNVPVKSPKDFVRERVSECRSPSRLGDLLGWAWRENIRSTDEQAFQAKADLARAILQHFDSEVRASGARFALIAIPHHEFRRYEDHERILHVLEEAAKAAGFPVLDLTDPLQEPERADPARSLYDKGHWNAAGSAEATTRIVEFLKANGVL